MLVINVAALQPAPLMTVQLQLGTQQCLVLIDTGASTNLIRESCVPEEVKVDVDNSKVVGLGGEVCSLGSVCLAVVIPGLDQSCCRFLVVMDTALAFGAVLGEDFFVSSSIGIDVGRSRLIQKKGASRAEVYLGSESTRQLAIHCCIPVRATEMVKLVRGKVSQVPIAFPAAVEADYVMRDPHPVSRIH